MTPDHPESSPPPPPDNGQILRNLWIRDAEPEEEQLVASEMANGEGE